MIVLLNFISYLSLRSSENKAKCFFNSGCVHFGMIGIDEWSRISRIIVHQRKWEILCQSAFILREKEKRWNCGIKAVLTPQRVYNSKSFILYQSFKTVPVRFDQVYTRLASWNKKAERKVDKREHSSIDRLTHAYNHTTWAFADMDSCCGSRLFPFFESLSLFIYVQPTYRSSLFFFFVLFLPLYFFIFISIF